MVKKITNLDIVALFVNNYKKKVHVRELARQLKKNHSVILPYLKALVKDKVMLFNTTGKNKEYFLNLSNIHAKHALVSAEINKTDTYLKKNFLIKKINDELFKLELNSCIILFGSYVKGYFDKNSDVDLFIIKKTTKKENENIKEIGEVYDKEINVHDISLQRFIKFLNSDEPLAKEIIAHHILLDNAGIFINVLWGYFK